MTQFLTNTLFLLLLSAESTTLLSQQLGMAWGDNSAGQLAIFVGLSKVEAVAAGGYHSVALLPDGSVLDQGTYLSGSAQVPASLPPLIQIAAGFSHTVALARTGSLYAWGDNSLGQTNVPIGFTDGV